MGWDQRDNRYTLRIWKLRDGYKIDGLMEVRRPPASDDDAYLEPVPDATFYLSGLGSIHFDDLQILNGDRGIDTRLQSGLHRVHPDKNLGPRAAAQ